jgi:glucose/arabinose dehydrogenase
MRSTVWTAIAWLSALTFCAVVYSAAFKFAHWEKDHANPPPEPFIGVTRPANGETGVLPNTGIAADVYLPHFGEGVDSRTMTTDHVQLFKVSNGKEIPVPGHVNTSGGGDSIVFQPTDMLDTGTTYKFACHGVRDGTEALFKPFEMKFTTATDAALKPYPAAFEHIPLKKTEGTIFTGLTVGPDHRLYAGTFDGRILRYDFLQDGMLSEPFVIDSVLKGNKSPDNLTGGRLITGICFDPASTPENMVLWITNGYQGIEHCPDWSCKLSRLSGPDFSHYEDYVVGLPRAWRDHLSFKIAFGPDGALYFNQGSCSSTGAPDNKWGLRNEHLLTAACLRVDTTAIARRLAEGKGPLDAKTKDDGPGDDGHYDPFAPDAPLTLYATGIRCGFGLLWHSNGHLYSCLNGGAAGGAAPATPEDLSEVPHRTDEAKYGSYNGGPVPAITYVTETQPDLVIDIVKGAYYGHPNITRGEYVLFGGNPDGGSDKYQVHAYKIGTKPDRNWHPAIWNNGLSPSANGLIEYKGDAFNGALNGKILTTRYSIGKDIEVFELNPQGRITKAVYGIDGFTQFVDPLDLVEDDATGNLYVSEFGGRKLTLLRPRKDGIGSRRTIQQTVNKSAAALVH